MPIETLKKGKPIPLVALNNFKKKSEIETPECFSAYDRNCLACAYCDRRSHCKTTTEAASSRHNTKSIEARIKLTQELEAIPL
ncbi:MAG: hypothetical protein WC470_03105 [Candidatus Paceibacterota bacterium]